MEYLSNSALSCLKYGHVTTFDIPGDGSWTTTAELFIIFLILASDLPHMHAGASSARAATPP